MFPFVPSGSLLSLQSPEAWTIAVGDIVAFAAEFNVPLGLTTHRVIAVEHTAKGTWYVVRGDAQRHEHRVASSDIVDVVTHVWFRGFAYDTHGCLGRLLAHVAVRRGLGLRLASLLARAVRASAGRP